MDWWTSLEALLRCQPGNQHLIFVTLGGLASAAAAALALNALWRWIWGPTARHRRAAQALREQARQHVRLNQRAQAMELYNFSVALNPNAAETYYLRGCLKEEMDQINRAIADWKRCLHRHPKHAGAVQKLAQYGVAGVVSGWPSWAIATAAGMGAVAVVALAGAYAL